MGRGEVRERGKGLVQTPGYKINKIQGCHIQHKEYSQYYMMTLNGVYVVHLKLILRHCKSTIFQLKKLIKTKEERTNGRGVGGRGIHLSPRMHQEYTFRHRNACRTPAESR